MLEARAFGRRAAGVTALAVVLAGSVMLPMANVAAAMRIVVLRIQNSFLRFTGIPGTPRGDLQITRPQPGSVLNVFPVSQGLLRPTRGCATVNLASGLQHRL